MLGDTHAINRAQILSLWESVEGAQRFIPQAQHKHIVRECVDMYEINPKTLQSRQTVHLFLLNDCLLVARKRSNHRLVAEYCWSIQDLTLMDMKDTEGKDDMNLSLDMNSLHYRTQACLSNCCLSTDIYLSSRKARRQGGFAQCLQAPDG